jgi:NTP pyrophosphatase (non-canonical NTP hydrolase)
MAFCDNCGEQVAEADNYCGECGSQLCDNCYYCQERMNALSLEAYQDRSQQTAGGYADPRMKSAPDTRMGMEERKVKGMFLALALNGEAGDLGEKVKKYVRENEDQYLEEAKAELGDVLWYLSQLATLLDVSLEEVAEDNLDKLLDRQERGQITGQGDDR